MTTDTPPAERERTILDALRRLPLRPGADVEFAARELARVAHLAGPRRPPNIFAQGTERANRAELKAAGRVARALIVVLNGRHAPTNLHCWNHGVDPSDLAARLLRLVEAADNADAMPKPEKSGRGAPENLQAAGITRVAAAHYAKLTGLAPTYTRGTGASDRQKPDGPFLDLLTVLFNLAGANASPAAQANKLRQGKAIKSGGNR